MGCEKLNEIGSLAGELLRAFLSHDAAKIVFAKSIFAVHGVNSPAGRIPSRPTGDAALASYADERLSILRQVEALSAAKVAKHPDSRRWTAEARKERKSAERLITVLATHNVAVA
jgi:hypothetical protein